jgi:hypothetical protein
MFLELGSIRKYIKQSTRMSGKDKLLSAGETGEDSKECLVFEKSQEGQAVGTWK